MTDLPALFHYSAEPLGELRAVPMQRYREGGTWTFIDKPQGLWLSVEDAWEEWCRDNGFRLDTLCCKTRIVLKETPRLLLLESVLDIREFQGKYGMPHPLVGISYPGINWTRVAEKYAGIVIAPYQWSLRFELMWYYTWDCASGCIWDPSIIERVEIVEEPS
jgi:hypothetical protein